MQRAYVGSVKPLSSARVAVLVVVSTLAVLGGFSVFAGDASACGGFFARRPAQATEAELAKSLPYLTVEQVLVLWDEDTGIEDFVREARFDRTNQSFGFVVPVPSKPEVFPVKKAPFDALRKELPFDPPRPELGLERGGGLGLRGGGGAAPAPPPVVVLSEQRIGSFTAFVLMANDRTGFDKWLDDNGFTTTSQSSAWLAEYVKLGFFFVALRYEPTKGDAGAGEAGMTSETLRIRFKTPLPYYPYREPEHAADTPKPDKRMLSAWLVTKQPMRGVVQKRSTRTFHRPWAEGLSKTPTREALATMLGELGPLLPAGAPTLHVTTYRDLKTSREGYGDALFVPETSVTLTAAQIEARRPLLRVLDWRLGDDVDAGLDETPPAPIASAPPSPAPSASAAPTARSGCSASGAGASAMGATTRDVVALIGAAVALIALVRRSRRAPVVAFGLVAALVACKKPAPTADASAAEDAGAPTNVVAAPAPGPRTKADLEKDAIAIFEGRVDRVAIQASEQPGSGFVGLSGIGAIQLRGKVTATGKTKKPVSNFDRVVATQRARLRACYQNELKRDPGLEGKIVVGLEIAASGEVADAKIEKNEKMSPPVTSCVLNAFKHARFDAPADGATTGTVEVAFQPEP